MKLWHDDMRAAPDDSWTVARTNDQALALLRKGGVTEASLDHDLGFSFDGHEDGYGLTVAMVEEGIVPPVVNIHSWNGAGADRMAAALRDGSDAVVTINPATFL